MEPITLSRRQAKEADRVGGIELMLPWPPGLPRPRGLAEDEEREAGPREKAAAEAMLRAACEAAGLVPVHVRVAVVRRPHGVPDPGTVAPHLAVTIIGRRWVHASTRRQPLVMWAQ